MNTNRLVANRFELHDLLGRGARSVGEVYRAFAPQSQEMVAVKAIDLEALINSQTGSQP